MEELCLSSLAPLLSAHKGKSWIREATLYLREVTLYLPASNIANYNIEGCVALYNLLLLYDVRITLFLTWSRTNGIFTPVIRWDIINR